MNGRKIVTTLTVIALILSMMAVINTLVITIFGEAGAVIPGVDAWGNATTDLEYGVSYPAVYVNSSKWAGAGPFYLYYPTYRSGGTGGNANEFTWDGPYQVAGFSVRVTGIGTSEIIDTGGAPISFNRSGMWIFDEDATHAGNDNTSYAGYLWVNTSTKYSIEDVPDFSYGSTGGITITVNTANDTGCMIAIMNPDNHTIYHKWRTTGMTEPIGKDNFTSVGTYTVKAYRDFDAQNGTYYYPNEYFDAGGITENYSQYYGSGYSGHFPLHPSTTPEYYDYTDVGPWDSPEKNATTVTFTVHGWLYVGGSGPGNYTKIQDAINESVNGDTVFVYNGTYVENIVIDKEIALKGEDNSHTIIDGDMKIDYVVRVMCNSVNISNFKIIHAGDGIQIFSNNTSIFNNNLTENVWIGIAVYGGSDNIIYENVIINNCGGILLKSGQNNHIERNAIIDNIGNYFYFGIDLYNTSHNEVIGNVIKGSPFNIFIEYSWENIIDRNVIEDADQGGIYIFLRSHHNVISNNTIRNPGSVGIEVESSGHNKIIYNNFMENSRHAFYTLYNPFSGFNINTWDGNYWDNWLGFVTPKIIVGQLIRSVIRIPVFAFDWHPAKEPYDIPEVRPWK